MIRAVSFDCAETLLKVRWAPAPFALQCAEALEIPLDKQVATEIYERLFRSRYPEFLDLNRQRNPEVVHAWWRELTTDWLEQLGQSELLVERLLEIGNHLLYDSQSNIFELFDDVIPTLDALRSLQLPMIVISNWDESLHRVLESRGLLDYFKFAVASLVEGVEKPNPRLFHLACERLGMEPSEVMHIGDSAVDDLQGAQGAGMKAKLLDRSGLGNSNLTISSLLEVPQILSEFSPN